MALSALAASAGRGARAENVRRIFDRFDTNGDGGLDRDEVAKLVVAINPRLPASPAPARTQIRHQSAPPAPFPHSPFPCRERGFPAMALSASAGRGARAEKVRRIFDRFDTNGDGGLDRDEMAKLVVAVNPRVKFSQARLRDGVDRTVTTGFGENRRV